MTESNSNYSENDNEPAKETVGFIFRNRKKLFCFLLASLIGTGGAIWANTYKVPMDGPDSHEIPLIHKLKYDLRDLIRGNRDEQILKEMEDVLPEDEETEKPDTNNTSPSSPSCGPDDNCMLG